MSVRVRGMRMRASGALLGLALAGCPAPATIPDDAAAIDADGIDGASDAGRDARADAGPDAGGCAARDDDGDGHPALPCGGDDCDDADANRFPGNTEVCDVAAHDEDCDDTSYGARDADSDGHDDARCCNGTTCGDDCDDTRADVFGGTSEACDMRDNDCDGAVDEAVLATLYTDADRDGYGVGTPVQQCAGAPGFATAAGDCDDTSATRSPGATELCASSVDEDCDGLVDESGPRLFFRDADADGYGDPGDSMMTASCTPPTGYASNSRDCADGSASVHPGASDLCNGIDDDCTIPGSGGVERAEDRDLDGHASASASCTGGYPKDDCNDAAAAVYGGALEICDGLDDDCSSGGALDPREDMDGDLHAPVGAACVGGTYPRNDCQDGDPTIYVGAIERCDVLDNDCSSGGGAEPREDMDGDGHASTSAACFGGLARDDCDDANAAVHGGAAELCDGLDTDCSSGGGTAPGEDVDGDRHAAPAAACAGGYPKDDCDDADAAVLPGAAEICDRLDENCSSGGGIDLLEDVDGDGHSSTTAACVGGYPNDDCDDTNDQSFPGVGEWCNRIDDDCSSGGGLDATEDADADGYAAVDAVCYGMPLPTTDCADADPTVHPGAVELCDRVDSDCSAGGGVEAAEDGDGDGHAPIGAACTGGTLPRDDCDDLDPAIHPGSAVRAPRLVSPFNGATTGSVHASARGTLRPTFRWTLGGCSAVTYDLVVDDSCAPASFGACTFPSPEHSATGIVATSARPPSDLPVSSVQPVGRRYYWRVRACTGATCSPWSSVRYVDVGRVPSDVNGDGWSDVLVGAFFQSAGAGAEGNAFVHYGSATGVAMVPSATLDNPANQASGYFGTSIGSGDVNGDGYADVFVGARWQDAGSADEGNAFVYLGSASGVSALPTTTLDNPDGTPGGEFGRSIASAGDLDGDGYADLVVGASVQAAAYVYRGSSTGIGTTPTTTLNGSSRFGWSVASAGDVDDDGYADLVVGAYAAGVSSEGNAFVFMGGAAGVPSVPSLTLANPAHTASGWFGYRVAGAGDIDADGYADVLVGAIGERASQGGAFVYHGSASGIALLPTSTLANPASVIGRFGIVSSAGDVNDDGYADVVVGAYTQTAGATSEGNAFVYLGGASGLSALPASSLDNPANQMNGDFGWSVAAAGDVDGDGFDDVLVGADQQDAPASNEGNVFVYRGSAAGIPLLPTTTLDNPANQASGAYGYSVAYGAPSRRGAPPLRDPVAYAALSLRALRPERRIGRVESSGHAAVDARSSSCATHRTHSAAHPADMHASHVWHQSLSAL